MALVVHKGQPNEATIVKAVYWADGEIYDHEKREQVPEYHYHLLDADGVAIGHGDGYLSEEHVAAALANVLDGHDVAIAEGPRGMVHPLDAAQGKFSATGNPHCLNCGQKVASYGGECPSCGTALTLSEEA